jgi:hypothetical protein
MATRSGKYYVCDECLLKYESRELAERCEAWDRKYHACSIEIARHAVK